MAFDATKPVTNEKPAVSANIRANWLAIQRTLGGVNLVADPTFLIWHAGDTTSPSHYTTAGVGVAVARTGTGLGDTNNKVGPYACKITSGGGAQGFLEQSILSVASFDTSLRQRYFSYGAWVRATSSGQVSIYLYDGIGTTYSTTHPGGSAWVFLSVTRQLSASATRLSIGMQVEAGTLSGYISGETLLIGEVPPVDFIPSPVRYESREIKVAGTLSTGADKERMFMERPFIVKDVFLSCKTAPTTQAIIVDVNTWDGAAFTSMFSTRPQIAATLNRGSARPDTTYARRCGILAQTAGTPAAGEVISIDIDQVGSGTAGSDLTVIVRFLTFERPFEIYHAYNE